MYWKLKNISYAFFHLEILREKVIWLMIDFDFLFIIYHF